MNRQSIIEYVDQKFQKREPTLFRVGDTVRVSVKIIEGDARRVQVFEGTVISMKGHGAARTFSARKISFGVGVERTFPMNSPTIEKIVVVRSGHARRAKLYYLRDRLGKAAKLVEKDPASSSEGPAAASSAPRLAAGTTPELAVAKEK